MFDIGWSELLLIGVLALALIGPRDLPRLLREWGRFFAQARAVAGDFRRAFEDAADEAAADGQADPDRHDELSIAPPALAAAAPGPAETLEPPRAGPARKKSPKPKAAKAKSARARPRRPQAKKP